MIRQKILRVRLRKFEEDLTVPNITREMFRGSSMESILPPVMEVLSRKMGNKGLIGAIGGFLAGIGSLFAIFGRKRAKARKERKKNNSSDYNNTYMFV